MARFSVPAANRKPGIKLPPALGNRKHKDGCRAENRRGKCPFYPENVNQPGLDARPKTCCQLERPRDRPVRPLPPKSETAVWARPGPGGQLSPEERGGDVAGELDGGHEPERDETVPGADGQLQVLLGRTGGSQPVVFDRLRDKHGCKRLQALNFSNKLTVVFAIKF